MSAAAGHPLSGLVWALTPVDMAQNAINKRARREVFEVMKNRWAPARGRSKRLRNAAQALRGRAVAQRWTENSGLQGAGFKQRTKPEACALSHEYIFYDAQLRQTRDLKLFVTETL